MIKFAFIRKEKKLFICSGRNMSIFLAFWDTSDSGSEFSMQKSIRTFFHVLSSTSLLLNRYYEFLTLPKNLGVLLSLLQHFKLHLHLHCILDNLIECSICYRVETIGRWVWNVGVLWDLWSPPGLSINVSGVLPWVGTLLLYVFTFFVHWEELVCLFSLS